MDTFRAAMELDPVHMEIVSIPYENTTLPGYFYSADESGEKKPLLITRPGMMEPRRTLLQYSLEEATGSIMRRPFEAVISA